MTGPAPAEPEPAEPRSVEPRPVEPRSVEPPPVEPAWLHQGPSPGRRPPAAVLLVAGALLVGGTGTAALVGARPDPQTTGHRAVAAAPVSTAGDAAGGGRAAASGPPGTGDAVDPATALARSRAVLPLLTARADAVRSGRDAAWTAGLDPAATASAFRAAQLQALDRIRALAPTAWGYELVGTEDAAATGSGTGPAADSVTGSAAGAGVAGQRAFVAHVRLRYRLSADTRDVVREQYLPVVPRAGRWYLGGGQDPRTERALWDLGELTVRRGRRCLVVGVGDPAAVTATVRRTAALADAAALDVDAAWGTGWPRQAVVVVPATRQGMADVLGRGDDDSLDQVAAITSGELDRVTGTPPAGAARGGVADRVVLNPGPFARLSDLGRRVVLTHELTHVATRSATRLPAPLWVEEGFANYVAYRISGLRGAVIAADALSLVRAGQAPQDLPDAAAFDPSAGPIAAAYADAWLAFDLMARGDASRPARFFRVAAGIGDPPAASADAALAQAFSTVLGTSRDAFEGRWRAYRAELAGVAPASGSAAS